MAGKKGRGGKKGRSGRKSKRFEFEVSRLKELSLKRAIKILEEKEKENIESIEDLKDSIRLQKRQDDITLKVIDKTLTQEVHIGGDPENPVKFEFYLPKNNGHLNNGNGNGHSLEAASRPSRIIP